MKRAVLVFLNRVIEFLTYIHKLGLKHGLEIYWKTKYSQSEIIEINYKGLSTPLFLRSKTSDIGVFQQIFFYNDYDLDFSGLEPKVIVDCGANIGLASVFFKSKYPDSLVIAVEPETSNFNMLIKNTKNYEGVKCIKKGVWSIDSWLKIENKFEGSKWAFSVRESLSVGQNDVEAVSINSIMEENQLSKIDILKIDIEGSEIELFSGNYKKWLDVTNVLIIELHDRYRKGTSKAFFKAISEYNFITYTSGENIVCVREDFI